MVMQQQSSSRSRSQLDLAQQGRRTVESPGAYAANGHLHNGYFNQATTATSSVSEDGSGGSGDAGEQPEHQRNGHAEDNDEGDTNSEEEGDGSSEKQQTLTRHGLVASEENLRELENRFTFHYTEVRTTDSDVCMLSLRSRSASQLRHQNGGRAKQFPYSAPPEWRAKDRVKTVHGSLIICLRIGFDPPDIVKTNPCARLEAWVDTAAVGRDRAMETISANLSKQYESLAASSKAKFVPHMDPAHEDLRKLCIGLRRKTRNDRALFHYNGHGVPRPTSSGEIWVFNRQYTQYIPVNVADVVGYLGGPSVYLWDVSNAGHIVNKIVELQNLPEGKFPAFSATTAPSSSSSSKAQQQQAEGGNTPSTPETAIPQVSIASIQDIVQLGACQAHETLPMNPDLPADLFTSCVTSPIEMSIRYFLLHNPMRSDIPLDISAKMPGKIADRKSPLGELTWIFTSVADTIAWNMIPRHLFQRLFRHDLVLAAIFRGFLLAERIMRRYNCTPISVPALPACFNHPLWDSWDLALDRCLAQMPALAKYEAERAKAEAAGEPPPPKVEYNNSYFFSDHLSAISNWIEQGTARTVDVSAKAAKVGLVFKNGHKRTMPPVPEETEGAATASAQMTDSPRVTVNGHEAESSPGRSSANHHGTGHTRQRTNRSGHSTRAVNGSSEDAHSLVQDKVSKGAIPVTIGQLKRAHKTLRIQAESPEHLPILLQVLLSQVHRLRALMLLCKFLDLGSWAVNLGLAIGIFPYVLKLLQAPGPELRPVLVYIWARILAVYRLCQEDLAKGTGLPNSKNGGKPDLPFHYFAGLLDPQAQMLVIPNVSEHRAMCCFVLSIFMRDYPYGQQLALTSLPVNARSNVLESCAIHLTDEDPLLRQWAALTIGILWDDFDEAKGIAIRMKVHSELTSKLHTDSLPEVRAACLFALGVFVGCTASDPLTGKGNAGRCLSATATDRSGLTEQWQSDEELGVVMATLKAQSDASPLVRKELVIVLSSLVWNHRGSFVVAAYEYAMERRQGTRYDPAEVYEERMNIMEQSLKEGYEGEPAGSTYSPEFRALMFGCMYKALLDFACDPCPAIAERGKIIVDYIQEQLLLSDLPVAKANHSRSATASDEEEGGSQSASTRYRTSTAGSSRTDVENAGHETPKRTGITSAFRALARMGLADVHAPRHPSAARARPASPVTTASIATSRSVANLGDTASVTRSLRHVSSADSLLHAATTNAARHSAESSSTRTSTPTDVPKISVQEAKEALFRSDAERHRKARQTPAPVVVRPARVAVSAPLAANPAHAPPSAQPWSPAPTVSDESGNPTSSELPLRSELFDWSAQYFIDPQMKEKENEEPGSLEYSQRHWRRERNEKILMSTQAQKEGAANARWDLHLAELDTISSPDILAYHQFEPHIAIADPHGVVR